MISGIGIDTIEIARVAKKCEGANHFMEKMFSPEEIARSLSRSLSPYEHLAACFAAREAFFKATQIWYNRAEVSVAQYPSGEPYYVLSERITAELGTRRVKLSLTHDREYACAFCICEDPAM
jgi:holo-[acyl-carrier protein] synthase